MFLLTRNATEPSAICAVSTSPRLIDSFLRRALQRSNPSRKVERRSVDTTLPKIWVKFAGNFLDNRADRKTDEGKQPAGLGGGKYFR